MEKPKSNSGQILFAEIFDYIYKKGDTNKIMFCFENWDIFYTH